MTVSKYKTCGKCGLRHSTLVRHKCAKLDAKPDRDEATMEPDLDGGEGGPGAGGGAGEQKEPSQGEAGETIENDKDTGKGDAEGEGGEGSGKGGGDAEGEGEGDGQSDGGGDADGDGEADGQAEGEGKGAEQGEGQDGDGEQESEAPEPEAPEPEAPPVAVVCSVLKFAALTAQHAQNGTILVELAEDGLVVYGHNGDLTAHAVIPWGEFEARSTVDGQFYVKAIINEVDAKLAEEAEAAFAEHGLEVGDTVRTSDGRIGVVLEELEVEDA